ncbi:hypothetical protein CCMA1212_008262 [Trichoderma ghanense]|uniref:Uncharacterized protein n=1 Tax=Trichoderma ghanense TaxID=65468 RepID=A0ABY2GX86_9HYPO
MIQVSKLKVFATELSDAEMFGEKVAQISLVTRASKSQLFLAIIFLKRIKCEMICAGIYIAGQPVQINAANYSLASPDAD